MHIHVEGPKKICSQCGFSNFHYWDEETRFMRGGGTKKDTWIQCNFCGHKKIDSTLTTSGNNSISYILPKPPEFETF